MAHLLMNPSTILLVDDEAEVLRLFKRLLCAKGTLILEAQTGAQALKIARQARLDLILLDLKLPDMSGMEVLRRMRTIDTSVPVIIVTSHGSVETVRASMELGAFDYLTKPFDNQEIRRVARQALAASTGRSP